MQPCPFPGRRQGQGWWRDVRGPGQDGHERQDEQRLHRLHRGREQQNRVRRDPAIQEMRMMTKIPSTSSVHPVSQVFDINKHLALNYDWVNRTSFLCCDIPAAWPCFAQRADSQGSNGTLQEVPCKQSYFQAESLVCTEDHFNIIFYRDTPKHSKFRHCHNTLSIKQLIMSFSMRLPTHKIVSIWYLVNLDVVVLYVIWCNSRVVRSPKNHLVETCEPILVRM